MTSDGKCDDDDRCKVRLQPESARLRTLCPAVSRVALIALFALHPFADVEAQWQDRAQRPPANSPWLGNGATERTGATERPGNRRESSGSSSREVLLGTIETNNPPDIDAVASRMLSDGIDALEQGDVMLGRRQLEVLVERYPETLAAATARKSLGALYSGARVFGDQTPPRDVTPRWIESQHREAAPTASQESRRTGRIESTREDGAAQQAQRLRQLQDERRVLMLRQEFQFTAGDRVFFAETSIELGARARTVLAAQARWLVRHPDQMVTIEAHADDGGTRERDVALSERRGNAVRERLLEEGVEAARIVVQSFGRDRPVATCNAPECAAQNRRAVTRVGVVQADDSLSTRREQPGLAIAPGSPRRGRSD